MALAILKKAQEIKVVHQPQPQLTYKMPSKRQLIELVDYKSPRHYIKLKDSYESKEFNP